MQKHEIPRESKSEGRILYFFTGQSILTTIIIGLIGLLLGYVLRLIFGADWILFVCVGVFGVIGFILGAIKIPEIKTIPFTKNISGLYTHEAVLRYIKFKQRRSLKVLKEKEKN